MKPFETGQLENLDVNAGKGTYNVQPEGNFGVQRAVERSDSNIKSWVTNALDISFWLENARWLLQEPHFFLSFSHSPLILLTSEILSNKSQYRSRRKQCFCFDISESSYQIRKQEVKGQIMRLLKT